MSNWRERLTEELPVFGHRNWIVVADAAYPAQCRPGIETLATGERHIDVVREVLEAVVKAPHVRPVVYLDAELDHVPEEHAPGIGACREELAALLAGDSVKRLPHEQIIARLDAAGAMFRVLILKTDLVLPYTSVFIRLDCGYWSDEGETALRGRMKKAAGSAKRRAVRRGRAR
jgi:hypothetical protein